ncbi:MAG TPA: YncE family protein [Caulobacteraceae bacterium]|jgi:DNA-binding beta-propeller fold protein YncE|nr:YncE family protein [Caulobacteraceae bacterium]
MAGSTRNVRLLIAAAVAAGTACAAAASFAADGYSLTERFKGPDGGFDFISFDPVRGRVYVSRTDGVTALDVATGTVTGRLAPAQHSHAVLPLRDGSELLVTDAGTNSAHMVDAASGKLIADIPTGQKPDGAAFDPASGLALVMNGKSGDVTLIDPVQHKAVGSIAVGGALETPAPDGAGKVFITVEDQNRIAVIDTRARKLVGYYPLVGCEGPTGMAYASGAGVLVAACANKVAKVVRAADGQETASLTIGSGPDQVGYDPNRQLVFIPCGRDGVMEVVSARDPTKVAVIQIVSTQTSARAAAVDPATGKVYLPAVRLTPAAAGGRPTPKPGTFEVLAVSPAR